MKNKTCPYTLQLCNTVGCSEHICSIQEVAKHEDGQPGPFKSPDTVTVKETELVKALRDSVEVIKSWHDIGPSGRLSTEERELMWKIYYEHAPEMKSIREALKSSHLFPL